MLTLGSHGREETCEAQAKYRRMDVDCSQLAVEGRAEWRLAGVGSMRDYYARPGRVRGQCECQHFTLPALPSVDFSFMLYPVGMGMGGGLVEAETPGTVALMVSGEACEGVAFEVDLRVDLLNLDGAEIDYKAEVLAVPLPGGGRVKCDVFWPPAVGTALVSCRVLASPPPCGDGVLRLTSAWSPPLPVDSRCVDSGFSRWSTPDEGGDEHPAFINLAY